MSCSSYCQGLQSCLEPTRHVEPRVLRLKLAPSKSQNSLTDSTNNKDNTDVGGWSFLQSLATNNNNITSQTSKEEDIVYFPPNFKRSPSFLSEKSLEMCTESLGSETGSDGGESSDEMALLSSENPNTENIHGRTRSRETRRMARALTFPPPLASLSNCSNFQVRSRREGGRLVLEAVSVFSSQGYFHAERTDGRLRLHLMKDRSSNINNKEEQAAEEEAAEGEQEQEEVYDETELEQEGEEERDYREGEENWEAENGGNNAEGEMGIDKLPMPSRCKENESGNKRLMNWEPFWVAT